MVGLILTLSSMYLRAGVPVTSPLTATMSSLQGSERAAAAEPPARMIFWRREVGIWWG